MLADKFGGYRMLLALLGGAGVCLAVVATLPSVAVALAALAIGMGFLGMGNGSVFQIVPQRFGASVGIMTGIIGAAGGFGGFLLPSLLGFIKDRTGSFGLGFAILTLLMSAGVIALLSLRAYWRRTWPPEAAVRAGLLEADPRPRLRPMHPQPQHLNAVRHALPVLCAAMRHASRSPAPGNTWTVDQRDFPTNKGGLCQKGWTAAELLDPPRTAHTPLIRDERGGPLRPAGWDEALDRIVAAIARTQQRYGKDAVGVFGGGGLTNEKSYLLGKFARVALRTSQIDYNGRFCMSSAAAAAMKAFGIDRGLPFPLADIPGAETILLMGSNAAETMPPVMQYFQEQQRRGGSLIVVDPAPDADRPRRHLTSPDHAGHRCRAGQRASASRHQARLHRRAVHRRAHAGFRRSAPGGLLILAGSRGAHHRYSGSATAGWRHGFWEKRPPRWF